MHIQSPEPGLQSSLQLICSLLLLLRAVHGGAEQQEAMFALPQLLTQASWRQGHGATLCSELNYEIHCSNCILALKRRLKKYWFPAE